MSWSYDSVMRVTSVRDRYLFSLEPDLVHSEQNERGGAFFRTDRQEVDVSCLWFFFKVLFFGVTVCGFSVFPLFISLFFFFLSPSLLLVLSHTLIASYYHNQASDASFGPPSPSEHAQWWRVSPCPLAPSTNHLPLLCPVRQHSAAAGQTGKSGCWLVSDWTEGNGEGGD